MKNKVMSYIRNNNLINQGDKILVALSGGPDSVCLLKILYSLKDELNIEIGAAHLNHLLRGKEADEDERYVFNLCKSMNIECFIKRVDINSVSAEQKISSEMAGRSARYNFFDDIVKNNGYDKVATAHNANDQAETVIFRMMRGSGLEGLGGIRNTRDSIIRPILCLTRKEVEEYIEVNNLEPRIDKTNFEKIYNRNKIRLDILPYIKENFNEDIIRTLNRMATLLQKDNDFLEKKSFEVYKKYITEKKACFVINKNIFLEDEVIITRAIRNAVSKFSDQYYDFEMKHIYKIYNLANNKTGKVVHLPNNIYAENIYGDIYIKSKLSELIYEDTKDISSNKQNIDKSTYDFEQFCLKFRVIEQNQYKRAELGKNNLIGYFDFDRINNLITIRKRQNGDRIIPIGMNSYKKLKDIYINMKIPKDERDNIPIITFDDKISWVVGIKISNEFKVTNKTKNILEILVTRKDD